jgi:hypothetical protein
MVGLDVLLSNIGRSTSRSTRYYRFRTERVYRGAALSTPSKNDAARAGYPDSDGISAHRAAFRHTADQGVQRNIFHRA